MDRVAQLAEAARQLKDLERQCARSDRQVARVLTRRVLEANAASLGFPESEIPSAIDTALAGR